MPSGLLSQFHIRHASGSVTNTSRGERPGHANANDTLRGGEDDEVQGDENTSRAGSPFAAGQRRPRSDSTETDEQRDEKRRRQFAATLCTARGLPGDTLEDFVKVS